MEPSLVGKPRREEPAAQAIQYCMCGFVRHDIVGQAGQNCFLLVVQLEIPEVQCLVVVRVVGVRLAEGGRNDIQLRTAEGPRNGTPERRLEDIEGPRSDSVHVLGSESWIVEQGLVICVTIRILKPPASSRPRPRGKVQWRVERLPSPCGVEVDDVKAGPPGSRVKSACRHLEQCTEDPSRRVD